jgi:hypothetical protein
MFLCELPPSMSNLFFYEKLTCKSTESTFPLLMKLPLLHLRWLCMSICWCNSILFDPIVGGPEYPSQYGPNGSASIDKMDLHQQMDMHNHRKCSNGNFINNGKVDSVDLQVSYFVNPYAKVLYQASKIRFETCVYLQQHLHNKNS